jgi:hypothetical protein
MAPKVKAPEMKVINISCKDYYEEKLLVLGPEQGTVRTETAFTTAQCPDYDELAIDTDQSKGQVRRVGATHVDELVDSLTKNPPEIMEFIVWPDQGLFLLSVVSCG